MVNHLYDWEHDATRCQEYTGVMARETSHNDRVSCPDCRDLLTDEEWVDQWYPREPGEGRS